MNKLGFGIVGCGAIAPLHAEAIRSLSDDALLVAVSSNIQKEARAFGEKYGINWYEDYHNLLDRNDVDVVCICTPSGTHAEIAMEAAKFGKHILVEKPLDISLERIDRVIEACEKARVKLGVVFQLRFTKAFKMVYQAVRNERFGRLVLGEARVKTYRSRDYYKSSDWKGTWTMDGGGALMNQSIHAVDLLQWMMGPVKSVYAYTDTLVHEIEVEDTAVAVLRFANGALGVLVGATSTFPGLPKYLEIHGSAGGVVVEEDTIKKWDFSEKREEDKLAEQTGGEIGSAYSDPVKGLNFIGHKLVIEDMIEAILKNREPLVNGQEARKSVEIILAVYESARSGKEIVLPL